MQLQAVSLGCEVDLRSPRAGQVHSVFDRAVNLQVGGELWTVFGPDHCDTPFGLRLAPGGLVALRGLRAGDPLQVRAGRAALGRHVIDGRTAVRWAPTGWPTPAVGLAQRLAMVAQAARARAWPSSDALATDLMHALMHAPMHAPTHTPMPRGAGPEARLAEAVHRTVGCGPGLTPAGDDVLVGILTVLGSGAAGAAGAQAGARLADALAPRLPTTTDLSRHLILQAARGLPGGALQALGHALLGGAAGDGLQRALDPVLATGATSGADACLGLVAACRSLFPAAERLAA